MKKHYKRVQLSVDDDFMIDHQQKAIKGDETSRTIVATRWRLHQDELTRKTQERLSTEAKQ